jgi:dihydrofolate reductase
MTPPKEPAKIVLMMGISLDGFVAVPSGNGLTPVMEGGGGLPPEDPELTKTKLARIWEAGAHLMGRTTYEEMAAFWPTSTADYAAPMNEIPKVVFSKELERADWRESRIARGDLAEELAKLKGESDKDLIAWGGASFAQSLARQGLVDEYRLTVHPVAVADGEPLFKDIPAPVRLKHVDTKIFNSAALHVFQPA